MRGKIITTLAAMALTLAIPGVALANHSAQHRAVRAGSQHRHHGRHHAHTVRFVAASLGAGRTTSGTTTSGTTTTTTTAGETVGTVLSFEGGVLKITLADGTVLSGKVTEATQVSCGCPGSSDGEQGGTSSSSQGEDEGGQSQGQGDDEHRGNQSQGDSEGGCTVASLLPGATVQEAELTLTGTGAVWERVSLRK